MRQEMVRRPLCIEMVDSFKVFLIFGLLASQVTTSVAANVAAEGMLIFEDRNYQSSTYKGQAIVVSNADGTERRFLGGPGANPRWFPSGDRIAYFISDETNPAVRARGERAPNLPGRTVIVDLKGAVLKDVPYYITDISPDGFRLLVQRGTDPNQLDAALASYEIFIYDLRDDSLKKLFGPNQIPNDVSAAYPAAAKWFPDGKGILFKLVGINNKWHFPRISCFARIQDDGSGFRVLTKMPDVKPNTDYAGPGGFDISPDGETIVYTEESNKNLYLMDLKSLVVRQLTNDGRVGMPANINPVWSPQGDKIMYTRYNASDAHSEVALMTINIDGSNPRRVFPTTLRHWIKFFILFEHDGHVAWWGRRRGNQPGGPNSISIKDH